VLGQLQQGREFLLAISGPPGGGVLFLGGYLPAGPDGYLALATCDMALPGGVSSAASLLGARNLHAVAVAAGKFIVSGGWGMEMASSKLLDDAETWDGTSQVWVPAGRMPAGTRSGHTMTTLENGREVLIAGGGRPDRVIREVDLLDAASGSWSAAAPLTVPRTRHKALLLNDGRVLVVGGGTYPPTVNNVHASAELFDPATGVWTPAASMTDPRFDFDMVLLPDGRVLVAGGSNNMTDGEYGALSSAEVYDPATDKWTSLPPMHDRRRWPTLTVLSDGVYVAGGSFSSSTIPLSSTVLASVERLAWSELIVDPIDPDAGVPDGGPRDASTSDDVRDATDGRDGAEPNDAPLDASSPDNAVDRDGASKDAPLDASSPDHSVDTPLSDSGSSDRETGRGKNGCSCSAGRGGADAPAILIVLCAALIGTFRPRRGLPGR